MKIIVPLLLPILLVSPVIAQTKINQWNSNISTSHYQIRNDLKRVLIRSVVPGETFMFEAFDPNHPEVIGDIDVITIDPNATISDSNTVSVAVLPQPGMGRTYGAVNVKRIDLSAVSEPRITGVKISGNLGDPDTDINGGPGDITLGYSNNYGAVTGAVEVGGGLNGKLEFADSANNPQVTFGGNQTGPISINDAPNITFNGAGPAYGFD